MQIYGMSRDPSTKNFIIVYEYVEHGDLNNYLYENSTNMGWSQKLALICDISKSLKTLHGANLIHRDIHSGNVLVLKDYSTALTDFGICKHVDKKKLEPGKVIGVLPSMPPEVIKKQAYSKKSDIYSFGMIMWEVSASGKRLFQDRAHDEELALEICQGLRPKPIAGTPPCWIQLMEKCWDDDPQKRPDAEIIHKTLFDWLKKLVETPKLPYKVNTEFMLAENWRIRGQQQSPNVTTPSTPVSNVNDTPVTVEEGGMKVDAALISSGSLGNGEFQHPMAFYTSQLFDFSELDFDRSTAKESTTESQMQPSNEGGSETTIVEESSQGEEQQQSQSPQQRERENNNSINGIELLPIPVIMPITPPLEKLTINSLRSNSPEEGGSPTTPPPEREENLTDLSTCASFPRLFYNHAYFD